MSEPICVISAAAQGAITLNVTSLSSIHCAGTIDIRRPVVILTAAEHDKLKRHQRFRSVPDTGAE